MAEKMGRADYALEVEERLTADSFLYRTDDIIHILDHRQPGDTGHIDYWQISDNANVPIKIGDEVTIGDHGDFKIEGFGIGVDGEIFAMWVTPVD